MTLSVIQSEPISDPKSAMRASQISDGGGSTNFGISLRRTTASHAARKATPIRIGIPTRAHSVSVQGVPPPACAAAKIRLFARQRIGLAGGWRPRTGGRGGGGVAHGAGSPIASCRVAETTRQWSL